MIEGPAIVIEGLVKKVPNRFPTIPHGDKRIAIIGEAPGADEIRLGEPFVGASGRFLSALLSRAGVAREQCFLGNICQYRPANNDFHIFDWHGSLITEGMSQLCVDLSLFKPNVVVLLGNIPLKAAKDPKTSLSKKFKFSNSQWRGSIFKVDNLDSPFHGRKCLPSYHPAYCLRDYETSPLLQFDLTKAVRHSTSADLHLPMRSLFIPTNADEIIENMERIRTDRTSIALDIEGYIDAMSCISIAIAHDKAFTIAFFRKDGTSFWSAPDECRILRALCRLLEDPLVPKTLQNSLYDRFVLHYSYGIRVRGVVDDTMLKSWEMYSELEKSLAMQASLYTDEPYYKGERKSQDDKSFYEYCARDSAVTLEISQTLEKQLADTSQFSPTEVAARKAHYEMNVAMLEPLLYMEMRGIRYAVDQARTRRDLLRRKMFEVQGRLNGLTGHGFSWKAHEEIFKTACNLMAFKKAEPTCFADLGTKCKKDYIAASYRLWNLFNESSPDLATMGEIENLCEVSLNVSSNKQLCHYLYEIQKLPVQMSIPPRGSNKPPTPTTDYEALLKLSRECQKNDDKESLAIVQAVIELRALQTRQGMLSISADKDGRIRCGYNIVGSNTGRITCYESPTGSGYNLQTIPNYTETKDAPGGVLGDRDLFVADEGYWLFQCDLSGADGWTVAAYSAMLGDPTMLDDYRAGLSPFVILTLQLIGAPGVDYKDRDSIKAAKHLVKKDSWERFAMKRVQHGGSYLEGGLTISRNILKDSEGKLYLPPSECDRIKEQLFFARYRGIRLWHNYIETRLHKRAVLQAASGQVRVFFGRAEERLTKAVAFEPQANTTFATNLAMHKLWKDDYNCGFESIFNNDKKLLIEPLHQVHDALVGQFPKAHTEWAVGRIKHYFNNPLVIAGQKITIPFDGGYGDSWGNLTQKI